MFGVELTGGWAKVSCANCVHDGMQWAPSTILAWPHGQDLRQKWPVLHAWQAACSAEQELSLHALFVCRFQADSCLQKLTCRPIPPKFRG